MVDLEEDLCGFFSGLVGSKLVTIFADQWKKFGNFVQPCPLKVISFQWLAVDRKFVKKILNKVEVKFDTLLIFVNKNLLELIFNLSSLLLSYKINSLLYFQGYLYVHNMTLSEAPFPPILPNGSWKIEFRFYGKHNGKIETAFLLTVIADIRSKGTSIKYDF